MRIEENVPLRQLTTFRIGGDARYVIACETEEDVKAAFAHARERGLPLVPLGGGSNVLASDEGFGGVILRYIAGNISFADTDNSVLVTADAGAEWDALVRAACERSLWGIENLAGIPGTVGAAPVQNIGAYGSELADTFAHADVYDSKTDSMQRFSKDDCGFGYRESRFKHEKGLIILRVALSLSKTANPHISYKDLEAKKAEGMALDTPLQIADAVRAVRSKKFPDLSREGTAGSFFKNPFVSQEVYDQLKARFPNLSSYDTETGIKIPLAFILDQILGLRGFRMGSARLFETQPLVLVADAGATAAAVDTLAKEVEKRVMDAVGISIEREVRSLP